MGNIKMAERCGKMYEQFECSDCGAEAVASYVDAVRKNMVERRLCYHCNYWFNFLRGTPPHTIINGRVYSPGNRRSGAMRGMGGRRFDIEYIGGPHEGKKITTFDLWAGSDIPDRYRDDYPDTARFITGAEKVDVGRTVCWNPSDGKSDEYPSPQKAGVR